MKRILCLTLLIVSFFAEASTYNHYEHHKIWRQNIDHWVDWEAQTQALSALDALNVTKQKFGVVYLPEEFFVSLKARNNFDLLIENLTSLNQSVINEAAIIFVASQAPNLSFHELLHVDHMRTIFLDRLKVELEFASPPSEEEELYLLRYYAEAPLDLAVYSIALNTMLENYSHMEVIKRLANKTGNRRSDALRQFFISGFSRGRGFKDRLEAALLAELKDAASIWKPQYDDYSIMQNGFHPYARVGALAQKMFIQQWASFSQFKRNSLQSWHAQLSDLPNNKFGFSIVGEAIVNRAHQSERLPHHSRWNFDKTKLVAITLVALVAPEALGIFVPEIVGELAVGEAAQGAIFSRAMFAGEETVDAAYVNEALELTSSEATALAPVSHSSALATSFIRDFEVVVGKQVESELHHYVGEGAIEGVDYIANIMGSWHRVRRFPSSTDYALYEGVGSLGAHKVVKNTSGWTIAEVNNVLKNWTSDGSYRHILLLGKGQPESLFRHFGESSINRYSIPTQNLSSSNELVSESLQELFPGTSPNQLSSLTFDHRLDIVAHGNPYGPICANQNGSYAPITPVDLARKLYALGLRQLGVLKVQSCNVGGGFYLSKLDTELKKVGIDIGFIAAPKGYLAQWPSVNIPRTVFSPFPHFGKNSYEVIRTGLHQGFSGTRYY